MATVLAGDPSVTALLVARLCSANQACKERPAISQQGLGPSFFLACSLHGEEGLPGFKIAAIVMA